jgi:hypothetical protein
MRHSSIHAAVLAIAALFSAVYATPAAAELNSDGVNTDYAYYEAEPTRFEMVYELALKACPAARIAQMNDLMKAGDFLTALAKRANYTTNESILLKNYCLLWIQGRSSK